MKANPLEMNTIKVSSLRHISCVFLSTLLWGSVLTSCSNSMVMKLADALQDVIKMNATLQELVKLQDIVKQQVCSVKIHE